MLSKKVTLIFLAMGLCFSLCACNKPTFRLQTLAKSSIDLVADAHQGEVLDLLRTLMIKLYKRNPRELNKDPEQTIDTRLHQIFDPTIPFPIDTLHNRRGTAAIDLCFAEDFSGDRVLALIAGLCDMVRSSYNNRSEQFIFDKLDEQKLYNSARNLEIVVWRLSNKRSTDGDYFLLTNSQEDETSNLSFERLFGKLIALQDMMARITADRGNRTINLFAQSIASAAFLPVGL